MNHRIEEDKEHICPKCKVVLLDTKCPRCGGAMVIASLAGGDSIINRIRARQSSVEEYSISSEYFHLRRLQRSRHDDS